MHLKQKLARRSPTHWNSDWLTDGYPWESDTPRSPLRTVIRTQLLLNQNVEVIWKDTVHILTVAKFAFSSVSSRPGLRSSTPNLLFESA